MNKLARQDGQLYFNESLFLRHSQLKHKKCAAIVNSAQYTFALKCHSLVVVTCATIITTSHCILR